VDQISPAVVAANGEDQQQKKNTTCLKIKEKAYG
jgi:hypothetical protein